MSKKNIIAIALLGLGVTVSAFGQAADWEIKPAVKKPRAVLKGSGKRPVSANEQIQTVTHDPEFESRTSSPPRDRSSMKSSRTPKPAGVPAPRKGMLNIIQDKTPVVRKTSVLTADDQRKKRPGRA